MCFAVPYQVLDVTGNYAIIEEGKKILINKDIKVKKGDYIRVLGNMIVDKLSKKEGKKIQTLLITLNQTL